ncbi:DedA family protein [Streptacidiphilus sp. ASG 303]|uniref:DedA family protein n=1 Tax=Streptacidiphilus sp. ASG 303 TaxID=2896847 RepID=UPI001E396C6C|nr:DedA family protein [Streptacidiphilus sp. ASG 303]MCD0480996.1 DedA family protein [Streptacidiphilus sp. ASG 303]
MHIDAWIESVPPGAVYALVGLIIGLESLGIPLPGEIALVTAALLASHGTVDPLLVGVCATLGAVLGDSAGYAIGRKGGKPLFDRLGRRFPKHFGPAHLATAERSFQRWGMWAVFFGRFVALLRIFAGPLAGALRMPYWKFLTANVLGGVVWAGGTTAAVYYLGVVAEDWLKRFSWLGLALAVCLGAGSFLLVRRRAVRAHAEHERSGRAQDDADADTDAEPVAAPARD